ncbi:MAG: PPC domain-containing protein, partial [Pirellulaceae bacterium]|nr:PPC domain-containing protein [Pirellulaceae bacterium]
MPRVERLEGRVLLAGDAYEPNDDFESARNLGQGDQTIYNLSIHAPGNNDWFRWTAPAGGDLTIAIDFLHAQGDIDMALYDASQSRLRLSTSSTNHEEFTYPVAAGQNYYIFVYGFNQATNPDYTLSINGPEAPFQPYFYQARIGNPVDVDSDGYKRSLDVEADVDSNVRGDVYFEVWQDGEVFDRKLATSTVFTVEGGAVDYHGLFIDASVWG